ncbi:MAG: hypothetical protein RBR69_02900 [Candidatus Cloacimonadaceae bacterium]|jgi:type II secretory pathway pseudopilin PulG|nr:hypothetical protein [Candidatus Cloacimonadota bacterium]MCK9242706.1 hypothetical protein [Candidatus Cloacimonadota bacterium]MDD3533171.1 hypothetical protein [Candidatus Cloacimonadota bacterium]MDY0127065.1 hypothetical protein [Candidatus Cloacimonadaceae bacterium]
MNKMLRNEDGFTLVELVSVILLSTILIAVSAVGVIAFFKAHDRINKYVSVQQGVMETFNLIRHGMRMPATQQNLLGLADYSSQFKQFIGATSAKEITVPDYSTFLGYGSRLRLTPSNITEATQFNDYLEYYLDDGVIRATYIYRGSRISPPLYVFPKQSDRDIVEVTRFRISNENSGIYYRPIENDALTLIGVEIEAKLLIKDDPVPYKREYKTVKLKSIISKKHGSE